MVWQSGIFPKYTARWCLAFVTFITFISFITRGGFFNALDNSPIFAGRGDCDSLSTNSTSLLMFATSDKSLTMLSRLDHVVPRLILFGGVAASCNCDEDACTELATSCCDGELDCTTRPQSPQILNVTIKCFADRKVQCKVESGQVVDPYFEKLNRKFAICAGDVVHFVVQFSKSGS